MSDATCGEMTREGEACNNRPMSGQAGGKCHLHIGLPSTDAQREAARRNAIKVGRFVKGFLDEDERELYDQIIAGEVEPAALQLKVVAALAVRATRAFDLEAKRGGILPEVTASFGELRHSLAHLPRRSPDAAPHRVDPVDLAKQVEDLVAQDPGIFVRTLPPKVQEEVRRLIEGAGASVGAGA